MGPADPGLQPGLRYFAPLGLKRRKKRAVASVGACPEGGRDRCTWRSHRAPRRRRSEIDATERGAWRPRASENSVFLLLKVDRDRRSHQPSRAGGPTFCLSWGSGVTSRAAPPPTMNIPSFSSKLPPINELGESRGHCEGAKDGKRDSGLSLSTRCFPLVTCHCLLRVRLLVRASARGRARNPSVARPGY
jgi:hypothetical protein